MDTLLNYGELAVWALGLVTAGLLAVAPLTRTDWDNRALNAVRWVASLLHTVIPVKPTGPGAVGEAGSAQPKGQGK